LARRCGATLLLLAAAAGAACAPAPSAATTTLKLWGFGREGEGVGQLLPDFEREQPGGRVEGEQISLTATPEKLLPPFGGDATPDICPMGNPWIRESAALGALEPMQPYVDASTIVRSGDYFPGIWDTNVIDGRLFGVPWYVDTRLLFYRSDIL